MQEHWSGLPFPSPTLRKCWGAWRKGQIATEGSVDFMEEVDTELHLNCEEKRENGLPRKDSWHVKNPSWWKISDKEDLHSLCKGLGDGGQARWVPFLNCFKIRKNLQPWNVKKKKKKKSFRSTTRDKRDCLSSPSASPVSNVSVICFSIH